LGYLWGNFLPVNKRLWTSSMTLVTGGYCYLLLALFYYVIDVLEWSRGLEWLKWYGMNAIAAYMVGECINFRSVVHSVSYGLQPFLGDYYNLFLTFGNCLVLLLILRWMYRNKIFWKV
jgi:predicted acyltransferase